MQLFNSLLNINGDNNNINKEEVLSLKSQWNNFSKTLSKASNILSENLKIINNNKQNTDNIEKNEKKTEENIEKIEQNIESIERNLENIEELEENIERIEENIENIEKMEKIEEIEEVVKNDRLIDKEFSLTEGNLEVFSKIKESLKSEVKSLIDKEHIIYNLNEELARLKEKYEEQSLKYTSLSSKAIRNLQANLVTKESFSIDSITKPQIQNKYQPIQNLSPKKRNVLNYIISKTLSFQLPSPYCKTSPKKKLIERNPDSVKDQSIKIENSVFNMSVVEGEGGKSKKIITSNNSGNSAQDYRKIVKDKLNKNNKSKILY